MTTLLSLVFLAAQIPTPLAPATPGGDYIEARTAAVYAGACHYGAEYTTQGRAAVLGWSFDRGAFDGVSLAGVDLVVVTDADRNLAEPDAVKRSVLYLDNTASAAQRTAARAWLAENHAALVGDIVRVKTVGVDVARDGDAFRVTAGPDIELAGNAMPERECCRMSYNVWYEPFTPVANRLVGNTAKFRVTERALERTWSRPAENAVFFGAF